MEEARKEMLLTLDLKKARAFYKKYCVNKAPKSDLALLAALHKIRFLYCEYIPSEELEKSRKWLRSHGYTESIYKSDYMPQNYKEENL